MTENHELIKAFYQAFQNRDFQTMQNCYSDHAVFNDEVFVDLDAKHVRAMWEMFCVQGRNLQIEFSDILADEQKGSASWKANYTFSKTGQNVTNHIQANFCFSNGKIVKHTDRFNFYNWTKQALGITGFLLGWTSFLKNKVRKEGLNSLTNYMNTNHTKI